MTTYDISKLTENQIALLSGISADVFSEPGKDFGAWYDTVVDQAVESGLIKTKNQAKATLNQLIKKNVLAVDTTIEEGSSWLTLTPAGGDALSALTDAVEEADEDLLGDVDTSRLVSGPDPVISESAALQQDLRSTHTVPAPEEDDDEDLLGDIQADVIEGTPADEVADALEELYAQESEGDVDKVVVEQVVTHTEMYTVNEWEDAEGTLWEETIFADGSRTLKRRRLVSNSWRTDYWGAEFSGDKEKATTAKLAKGARVTGHFTHTPAPAADAA